MNWKMPGEVTVGSSEIIPLEKTWFSMEGPENDTVISSRIRISRNLGEFFFEGKLVEAQAEKVRKKITEVSKCLEPSKISDLSQLERRILMERNIISQEYTLGDDGIVLTGKEKEANIYGTVNHVDHLRLFAFSGGLDLSNIHGKLVEIEEMFEETLDFAVSLDLGYLTTDLTNLGTGMKVSTMLHLPAIAEAGLADKTCKAIIQIGLGVKGFWGDEEHSLGDMYQITNNVAFGMSEKELIEKLENITFQIVHYERKLREELAEKRRNELEDKIYRAYGILRHCRTLTAKEAIELLSLIRWGVVLGWFSMPVSEITKLMFASQTAHVEFFLQQNEIEKTAAAVDYYRAEMIRNAMIEQED